LSCSSS